MTSRRDFLRRGSLYVAASALVVSGVDALADPEAEEYYPKTYSDLCASVRVARPGAVVYLTEDITLPGTINTSIPLPAIGDGYVVITTAGAKDRQAWDRCMRVNWAYSPTREARLLVYATHIKWNQGWSLPKDGFSVYDGRNLRPFDSSRDRDTWSTPSTYSIGPIVT